MTSDNMGSVTYNELNQMSDKLHELTIDREIGKSKLDLPRLREIASCDIAVFLIFFALKCYVFLVPLIFDKGILILYGVHYHSSLFNDFFHASDLSFFSV